MASLYWFLTFYSQGNRPSQSEEGAAGESTYGFSLLVPPVLQSGEPAQPIRGRGRRGKYVWLLYIGSSLSTVRGTGPANQRKGPQGKVRMASLYWFLTFYSQGEPAQPIRRKGRRGKYVWLLYIGSSLSTVRGTGPANQRKGPQGKVRMASLYWFLTFYSQGKRPSQSEEGAAGESMYGFSLLVPPVLQSGEAAQPIRRRGRRGKYVWLLSIGSSLSTVRGTGPANQRKGPQGKVRMASLYWFLLFYSQGKRPSQSEEGAVGESFTVNGTPATITIETCESSADWTGTVADESLVFWQGLKDAGLLEEVIQEFHQELLETMKGLKQRLESPPIQLQDAVLLNNIVQNFGMLDLIKKVLAGHKSQMDRSREQYTRDLAALEQQCDEHRRRAKELKHKSQHLNNVLMTLTPVSVPPPAKRPRLSRATSGPAAITTQSPAQITLPQGMTLSQLSSLPFSKVLSGGSPAFSKNPSSPSSPMLGGYTIVTPSGSNFPSTLEIHPDSSNLTVLSTAAMQDSNTVLKVVSPIQLLTLQGLGAIQNLAQIAPAGSTIVAMPCGTGEGEEEQTTIEVTSLTEEEEEQK
uniref:Glucocorticoid modulatory element binding protein 2 n=1 Tax=Xenopus tropicalis TaxID=8364 RepID=A0A803JRH1_XENTR